MDEITLVRELGDETPLPQASRLAAARAELMSEVAPVAKRRWRWAVPLTVAAAAIVAVSQVAPPSPSSQQTAPPMTPVAAFLNQAAVNAEREKDVLPRGDQYLYVRVVEPSGLVNEAWLSIDGEHDSKGRNQDGVYEVFRGRPELRYFPDIPTDPQAMTVWIEKYVKDRTGVDHLGTITKFIGVLPTTVWMRPAQRAAFYRAISLFDGVRLVDGVTDSRGRTGAGVAFVSPGETGERVLWEFDATTHRLLGTKDTSIDRVALVDRIGQKG